MQNQTQSTTLPPQQISIDVLIEKYAKNGETSQEDIFKRVAKGIASVERTPEFQEEWENKFYENMTNGAIGAGRIMSAAGTNISATLINCFTVPVGDSINGHDEDGRPGIYTALQQSAATMQKGGGVGYNFSFIRPKGAWVKSVHSTASGPCSYMDIFDASCKTIESAGCFTGDTLINTTDGLIPIKQIVESDKDFYAITHAGPKKVTAKFRNGVKPVLLITTNTGLSVKVTKDHKFAQYENGVIVTNRIEDIILHKKNETLLAISQEGEISELPVWSFEQLGEEETYDLEVEDVHLLSGNGFYTSNSRRGAQMGVMNINHPDVLEFVKAKRTPGRWNNFNVSVMVTDEFMRAKEADEEFELVHKAIPSAKQLEEGVYQRADGLYVYGKMKARELWDIIMQSNYDFAEPGVLFFDNINNDNNLRYVETIVATNPCAEQPLPDYGCCDLGPIILPRFVHAPFTEKAYFDYIAFEEAVKIHVRFLDNVLDATVWPLPEEKAESDAKRRIGLGFTGLGNALAMLGHVYYEKAGVETAREISTIMRNTAYHTSVELAKEKGAFPLFDADKYLEEGTFASRLPDELKALIREHGIRNSHLLSIAPTGTVSLAFADNASNGIEPPYSLAYTRKKRNGDGTHSFYNVLDHAFRVWLSIQPDQDFAKAIENAVCNFQDVFDYGPMKFETKSLLPKSLVTAMSMTVDQHLIMMNTVQPYIDTAISKTVNVPGDYPFESFKSIYDTAWKSKLKGVSTYRPNSILGSVLSVDKPKEEVKPTSVELKPSVSDEKSFDQFVDEMLAESFQSRKDGMLQGITTKGRFFTEQGEQKFIVTINFIEIKRNTVHGEISVTRPVEFILTSNFTTNSSAWDATMRFMSLSARSGVAIPKLIENLKEITWEHGAVRYGTKEKDGRQVPLWHASDVAAIGHAIQEALISCGFLDTEGQVVRPKPDSVHAAISIASAKADVVSNESPAPASEVPEVQKATGKKCPECGAHNVEKRNGCEECTVCHWQGSCG